MIACLSLLSAENPWLGNEEEGGGTMQPPLWEEEEGPQCTQDMRGRSGVCICTHTPRTGWRRRRGPKKSEREFM